MPRGGAPARRPAVRRRGGHRGRRRPAAADRAAGARGVSVPAPTRRAATRPPTASPSRSATRRAQLYGLARIGLVAGPDGAPQGSALAVLFAGREPVAALARGAVPVAGGRGAGTRSRSTGCGRRSTRRSRRWTVRVRRRRRPGLRARVRGGRRPGRARRRRAGRAARRHGRLRPAVPRARDGPRRRPRRTRSTRSASAATRGATPDWERIELARTVTAWTDGACASLTAIRPAGARNHADEATWAALWEPERLLAIEDGRLSTTYDARRPHAPRRAGAVAGRRGGVGAARGRRGAVRLLARPRRAAAGLRVLPLAPRGPRGRRPLRHRAPRRVIRAVVSDFGGVLTAPLLHGFARIQDDTGRARREAFGAALARRGGGRRRAQPAPRARGRRDHRGASSSPRSSASWRPSLGRAVDAARLRRALHGRAGAERRAASPTCAGCASAGCGSRCCTNNVREWEPLWRAKLPVDELFETVVDSGVRRACASPTRRSTRSCSTGSGCPPARACSSTTSSATSRPRGALGFATVHFRDTEQAIAELDRVLAG